MDCRELEQIFDIRLRRKLHTLRLESIENFINLIFVKYILGQDRNEFTGCRVLKLQQMIIDDAMQSNTNFSHDTFQVLAVQVPLNLLDDRNNLLDNMLTGGRCQCIKVTFWFEVGFTLFTL